MFESFDRKIANMSTMLSRLGIDPAMAAGLEFGSLFASAIRACQACPAGEVCRDWLARGEGRLERAPAFCPNAQRFDRVKENIAAAGSVAARE
jgi:hypothetical protein